MWSRQRVSRRPPSHWGIAQVVAIRSFDALLASLYGGAVVAQGSTVRPAAIEDADAVWVLARDFATSFEPTRTDFDRTLPLLLRRADTALLVATDAGGAVVGYLLASTHLTFLANGAVAWVEEVMVRDDCRRRGIGQRLMSAAEGWATAQGAAYVSLASRRAGDFYLALGYDASATFYKKPAL